MAKQQLTSKYFPLTLGFCHLVFFFFCVFSTNSSMAQKAKKNDSLQTAAFEDLFLEKILSALEPNKNFSSDYKISSEPFSLFQKKNEYQRIWVSFWQYETFKYPLFVQEVNNQVEDFFLTFPSFFLHDKVLQLLILKWGKQDFFQHNNLSAIYSWKNIKGNVPLAAVYEANCSITCFPVALSMQKLQLSPGVTPLWQEFHNYGITKEKKKK